MKSSLRFFYLILLLSLQVLTLVGVFATSRRNTEITLQEHAEAAMNYSAEAIADNVLRYLSPAQRATELTETLLLQNTLSLLRLGELEQYFLSQLQVNTELAGIYIGQPSGDFFFVKREALGFSTKIITTHPERKVLYRSYSQNLTLIEEQLQPEDTYDPRNRPWYLKAVTQKKPVLTDPYLFFSSKRPGIAMARPVYLADHSFMGVVGVDMEISGLSQFLATIPISQQGAAFIMNRDGLAIAFPEIEKMISQDIEHLTLPQISEVGNDLSQGLLNQFAQGQLSTLEQRSFKEFILANKLQYGILSPFPVGDEIWLTGIYAPAEDFQGQIKAQYQKYLMQIIGIWVLVGLLAIPLVFGVTRPMVQIYEQATRDELTQLFNRPEFFKQAKKRLIQAQRRSESVAVAMLDLDGFKDINDTYGHQAGDEVLAIVGQRLLSVVRSKDLVGRLGGDEFAVMLFGVEEKEAFHLIERIRKKITEEPIRSAHEVYIIGATAGVADSYKDESAQDSLARADQALLDAKAIGKNCTLAFSDSGEYGLNYINARTS